MFDLLNAEKSRASWLLDIVASGLIGDLLPVVPYSINCILKCNNIGT